MEFDSYITKARQRIADVEQLIAGFDFGSGDQKEYRQLNREYQSLQRLLQLWDEFGAADRQIAENREMLELEDDEDFLEVVRGDLQELEARYKVLERDIKALIVPPHPNDGRDVIMEIRPAAGGEEASLFAGDLYRMYSRFAEAKGWKLEPLDLSETDLGGIKSAAACIRGDDVFRFMCHESGVHRVQRIPVTESGGRIHTSTVTVAVLAEAEEVDLQISPEELRIDVYRSQGPGGQSVNTTDSAVRITHIPSGLVVTSQQEKSQHRNKDIAMRILRSRLLELKQAEEDAKNAAERRQQVGTGDRSERIRTYNFPQNRVSDHRYNLTLYDLTNILEGGLDDLLGEIISIDAERRLAAELED